MHIEKHCIDFSQDLQENGSVLAISNNAGGGHKEAAKAICAQFHQQLKSKRNGKKKLTSTFRIIDIFQNSIPPPFSKPFAFAMSYHWNKAKREGNIKAQERLYNGTFLGVPHSVIIDKLLFLPVLFSIFFRLLFNPKISHIVITQPLGISGITKAVRANNYLFKKKTRISLVLTDLPTEGTIHYCGPIKKLSDRDKNTLKVIATKPLILDPNESEKEWWQRVYGLNYSEDHSNDRQILYRELPLRPAFLKWKDMPAHHRPSRFEARLNNLEEQRLLHQLLNHHPRKKRHSGKKKEIISIKIDPKKDFVGLVTIGSQASQKTKEYVTDFISVAASLPKDRCYTLFVACGTHHPGKNSLFKKILHTCIDANLPSNIRVIPMGYQEDDELAPLMHRMDFAVGSAGGLTSFELLRTAKYKIFLHSESNNQHLSAKNDPFEKMALHPSQKNMLHGISLWEKWNALYQVYEKDAEIVTPGTPFKSALLKELHK